MSNVEKYLERIAVALETLVNQGNSLSADFSEHADTPTTQPPFKTDSPTYTHDDLKQECLKTARADSANRDKLKALLKEYGAIKALDVPYDKVSEVVNRIKKGEF